jgi:hypothetical protein
VGVEGVGCAHSTLRAGKPFTWGRGARLSRALRLWGWLRRSFGDYATTLVLRATRPAFAGSKRSFGVRCTAGSTAEAGAKAICSRPLFVSGSSLMYLLEGIFTMKAIRNRCWRTCGKNNTRSEWPKEPGAIIWHAGMLRRAQHRSVAGIGGQLQVLR